MNDQIFEVDPIEQWLSLHHEPLRFRPWCVLVSGYVRAEFKSKKKAEALITLLRETWTRSMPRTTPKRSTT